MKNKAMVHSGASASIPVEGGAGRFSELIARLEAAEVGSRELDAEVWDIEDDRPRWSFGDDFPIYKRDPDDSVAFDSPPPYTTSLDAALALAERVLPDARRVAIWRDPFMPVGLWEASIDRQPVQSKTPALALCIAILKALEAKQ